MSKTVILWVLAAIAGVVLVAGVTYAASTLSTQTIGLSSEPLSAGEDLAPAETAMPEATPDRAAAERRRKARARARARARAKARATPTPTATPVPTAAPTVDDHGGDSNAIEPGDDSGGHGRNSGKGGGGDD